MNEIEIAQNILSLEIDYEPAYEEYKNSFQKDHSQETLSDEQLKNLRLTLEENVETLFAYAKVKSAVIPELGLIPVPERFDLLEQMFQKFEMQNVVDKERELLQQEKKNIHVDENGLMSKIIHFDELY